MNNKDLEKDCESTISQVLTEQNKELETITNEKTLANLSPKQQIAHWRDKFDKLSIADMKDTKGYTQVIKAIALCRTTRTTLDKKRMEQKRFFLDAGKVIDGHYKELIALVEPIEAELSAKKDVVDAEKEKIKQDKIEAEQKVFDDKVKQLIDVGATFNGVGYTIVRPLTSTQLLSLNKTPIELNTAFGISTIELKQSTEAQFAIILKNAQTEADMLKAEKEKAELEEKERVKKEIIDRRTEERVSMLKLFGFELNEKNWYARTPQSQFYKEKGIGFGINAEFLPDMEMEDFDTLIAAVRDDIKREKDERLAETVELQRREEELRKAEDEQKRLIREAQEKEERIALEKKQEEEAEDRAKELLAEKEKQRLAKEEEDRLKAEKKAQRQPDKAKLNTLAERILAMDIPEFKSEEAKTVKQEVMRRLTDISNYCKEEAGKL